MWLDVPRSSLSGGEHSLSRGLQVLLDQSLVSLSLTDDFAHYSLVKVILFKL